MNDDEKRRFCRAEYERCFIEQDQLLRLCRKRTLRFEPEGREASGEVLELVRGCLRENKPLSLIRVGNGEGNAISMGKPTIHELMYETFRVEFDSQNHIGIDQAAAVAFCADVIGAIDRADVLGFRSFRFNENQMIETLIGLADAYASLGFIYGREYLTNSLLSGKFIDKFITSAWIHLDIIPHFGALFEASDKIVVVSGRAELEKEFARRLGGKLKSFIPVPVQGYVPRSFPDSHLSLRYPQVLRQLSTNLEGCLVLVGAGLFGKVYCDVAKRHGAVALDLGSAFDVLSGVATRPVFKHYNFEGLAWL